MIQQAGGGAGGKIPVVSYLPTGRQCETMWSDHSDHSLGTTEQHVCSFYLREQCGDFTKSVITADGWLPRNNIIAGHVNLSNDNLFSVCKTSEDLLSNMKVVGGEMKQKTACISPFLHLNSLSTRAEIVPEQIGIWNFRLVYINILLPAAGKIVINVKLTSRGFTISMIEYP